MAYTNQQIQDFVSQNGIGGNPWALYGNAQKYGIGANQMDSAMGWNPGTSNNWIQQNGMSPLGGRELNDSANFGMGRTQYGYNQNPMQNGYYQQDTPYGSFAGASTNQAGTSTAYNPYIGAQSQGIQGVGQVGTATAGQNPYLGQTTQGVNYQAAQGAGSNPYSGQNSYLNGAIDANAQDMRRNFDQSVMPQLDRMSQQSGSFGNTGVQGMQQNAFRDLNNSIGNMSNSMRMQDYGMQQQLAENQLNRNQALNQFNAGNLLNAGQFNSSLQSGELARNLGAAGQLGMFNAGQLNNMGQFNANLGLGTQQFNANLGAQDLSRNSNLMQNMGQFNAGALNAGSMFNAGQGNQMNQFNAGSANNMIQNYLNRQQNQNQFDQNLGWNRDQFNQNMDLNVYNANQNWMNQGQQNQLAMLNALFGWNQGGINNATNVQNTPMNYWNQFSNAANNAGGVGGTVNTNGTTTGTNAQNMQGNPWLGAIGGALTGAQLWNLLGGGGGR